MVLLFEGGGVGATSMYVLRLYVDVIKNERGERKICCRQAGTHTHVQLCERDTWLGPSLQGRLDDVNQQNVVGNMKCLLTGDSPGDNITILHVKKHQNYISFRALHFVAHIYDTNKTNTSVSCVLQELHQIKN